MHRSLYLTIQTHHSFGWWHSWMNIKLKTPKKKLKPWDIRLLFLSGLENLEEVTLGSPNGSKLSFKKDAGSSFDGEIQWFENPRQFEATADCNRYTNVEKLWVFCSQKDGVFTVLETRYYTQRRNQIFFSNVQHLKDSVKDHEIQHAANNWRRGSCWKCLCWTV